MLLPGPRVAYIARQGPSLFGDRYGLFGAPLDGTGPDVRYNDPIVSDTLLGDVTSFQATEDGTLVVYRADQDADEVFDLYATHRSGLGVPLRLTAALSGAPLVLPEFVLTPAGERVLFQTSAGGTFALWSVRTGAGAAAVQLDTATFEIDLAALRASSDGARVVYPRRVDAAGRLELRSVPSDGSSPAVTLHPPLAAGHGVREFEIVPDGTRVVYRSGSTTLGIFELFSVPIDGAAPPVRLHAPLTDARAVTQFRITPNGRRVVFRGDLWVNEVGELYSASIEGGAAPRKLNGPLVAGGDVTDFALAPDGRTVVYRADQLADLRFDLAPVDGSGAPVKLSAPLVAGGDVRSFALAPDGSRVVYRADQRVVDVIELSSVPLAGGPAVVLDPLPSLADVSVYRIDPEAARVLYLADRAVNEREELFAVPLDASGAPVRLNRPLPTGGLVEDDFLVRPGGRTVYRAEQEQDGALELYVDLDLADAIMPATRARRR